MSQVDSHPTTDLSADATLAFLPAWFGAFDRRMIARDSAWLAFSEAEPDICAEMGDIAARSVMTQPAIMWG